mmetsp:Transcript_34397/g.77750  ORF Transcript_34397/g.77750 Transcript_34397/m.77750 type:complete len:208 (-) Transcript_34397:455-1078(-)
MDTAMLQGEGRPLLALFLIRGHSPSSVPEAHQLEGVVKIARPLISWRSLARHLPGVKPAGQGRTSEDPSRRCLRMEGPAHGAEAVWTVWCQVSRPCEEHDDVTIDDRQRRVAPLHLLPTAPQASTDAPNGIGAEQQEPACAISTTLDPEVVTTDVLKHVVLEGLAVQLRLMSPPDGDAIESAVDEDRTPGSNRSQGGALERQPERRL